MYQRDYFRIERAMPTSMVDVQTIGLETGELYLVGSRGDPTIYEYNREPTFSRKRYEEIGSYPPPIVPSQHCVVSIPSKANLKKNKIKRSDVFLSSSKDKTIECISFGGDNPHMLLIRIILDRYDNEPKEITFENFADVIPDFGAGAKGAIASLSGNTNRTADLLITVGGTKMNRDIIIWDIEKRKLVNHCRNIFPTEMSYIGLVATSHRNRYFAFTNKHSYSFTVKLGTDGPTIELDPLVPIPNTGLGIGFSYVNIFNHIIVFSAVADQRRPIYVYSIPYKIWVSSLRIRNDAAQGAHAVLTLDTGVKPMIRVFGGCDRGGNSTNEHWRINPDDLQDDLFQVLDLNLVILNWVRLHCVRNFNWDVLDYITKYVDLVFVDKIALLPKYLLPIEDSDDEYW